MGIQTKRHVRSIPCGPTLTLVSHWGFTAEELDFIINYDIKYRLGRESEEAE